VPRGSRRASSSELTIERVLYELGQGARFTEHEEGGLRQCRWQRPPMASTHEVAQAVHLLSDGPRRSQDLPHLVGAGLARDDVLGSDTQPLAGEVPELSEVGVLGHRKRQLLQDEPRDGLQQVLSASDELRWGVVGRATEPVDLLVQGASVAGLEVDGPERQQCAVLRDGVARATKRGPQRGDLWQDVDSF
jgi:hypothetical protein